MSVEALLLGPACNLACSYCYEHALRDAGVDRGIRYDAATLERLAAVKRTLKKVLGGKSPAGARSRAHFSLFGGEPLLAPLAVLEDLWEFGLREWGLNSMQSNGVLITPEHVDLFRKYNVHVGLSIDGPGELNDARWAGSVEKTRAATEKSLAAMELLRRARIPHSLIVTLHRMNASRDRLPRLLDWLAECDRNGMPSARLHTLELDHPAVGPALELSVADATHALLRLIEAERSFKCLKFDLFREIRALLTLDKDEAITCLWQSCDPLTTRAVQGVGPDGSLENCGRSSHDGVRWLKADSEGHERELGLFHTPQEFGGCRGCRFFVFCRGECPGTGRNGDWRNRTAHCATWISLFEKLEAEVAEKREPASRRADLGKAEQALLAALERGEDPPVWKLFTGAGGAPAAASAGGRGHIDTPHQNAPHTDWHRDQGVFVEGGAR